MALAIGTREVSQANFPRGFLFSVPVKAGTLNLLETLYQNQFCMCGSFFFSRFYAFKPIIACAIPVVIAQSVIISSQSVGVVEVMKSGVVNVTHQNGCI